MNGTKTMLTNLLPTTLRNTMFVLGLVMISVSGVIKNADALAPSTQAPEAEAAQCMIDTPAMENEVPGLS